MKLTRRNSDQPQKKESVKSPMSTGERKLFRYVKEAVMPRGKFAGKTLEYLLKHEQWYIDYLENNNLMIQWNLLELKSEPVRKPKPKLWEPWYNADTGETYMGIREIPIKTLPADESW